MLLVALGLLSVRSYEAMVYLGPLLAAAGQIAWHYRLIRDRTREGCFEAFRANHWVGLALFAGIVADMACR